MKSKEKNNGQLLKKNNNKTYGTLSDDNKCDDVCYFDKKRQEEILKAQKARKKLLFASVFCVIFMIAEIVGGYIAHSIALMSDALHLLSDCGGLLISVIALWMAQKEATSKYSYGYHRAEIVGALFSVFLIWGLTVWLVYEAINRFIEPEDVDGKIMFIVACCGIVVNVVMSLILHQGKHSHSDHDDESDDDDEDEDNMNVRAAFIHAMGDLVQSIGVLIAAILIWIDNKRYRMADPICTLIFSLLVLITTYKLMRDILAVLMESVPSNIDCNQIIFQLQQITDVEKVHDLHIWNLSMNKPMLSVHLTLVKSLNVESTDEILSKAKNILNTEFRIGHSTIQIEGPYVGNNDNNTLQIN